MIDKSYFHSTEFNRATNRAADTGIKIFFKWVNIAIKSTIDFITSAIKMAFGK